MGFPSPIDVDGENMKAPRQKGNRSSGSSYHKEKTYAPSNNYFDNIISEDVNAFFDFEPRSGAATPRKQEPPSKAAFDFGNGWDGFQPLSPPDSAVYPSDNWRHFDQGQMPHNILTQIDPSRARTQYGQTTPPDDEMSSRLEYQLGQQQHGLPSPESLSSSSGNKRKPSAVDNHEVSATPKRVRKSTARSSKNGVAVDPNDPEETRRSKFLERNRVAASKCRQKKKEWTQNLENKARDLQRQNHELRLVVDSCKEEILFLKGEMLKHTTCGCTTIQEYLQRGANTFVEQRDVIVKRETSPVGAAPLSPAMSTSSRRESEEFVPTSISDQASSTWQPTVEENLEALLQPQYAHDTSDEGIAMQVGH